MLIISHALCTSIDYDYNDCKRNKNTNLHPKSSNLGEFCLCPLVVSDMNQIAFHACINEQN